VPVRQGHGKEGTWGDSSVKTENSAPKHVTFGEKVSGWGVSEG